MILFLTDINNLSPEQITLEKPLCNAHGRRQFVDVYTHFPDEVEWVLEQNQYFWRHDDEARKQMLSVTERLRYHQTHSRPVMEVIREWGGRCLADTCAEGISSLGKAIRYFDNHFDGLIGFCCYEGAALDNNEMERQIKRKR